MKKILFISDHGDPLVPLGSKQAGGQNNYVKNLTVELDRKGYTIDVVTHWSDAEKEAIEPIGSHSHVYRFSGGQKGFVDKNELVELLPAMYEEMRQTLDLDAYDVVHTHYWMSGVLALMMKESYDFTWIHTNHSLAIAKERGMGVVDGKRKAYEKMILERADTILATTENEKQQIEHFIDRPNDIFVAPIGVAPIYLERTVVEEQFDFPYYFYAGRLEESKGIFDLIKAFRQIKESSLSPDVKLVIAGGTAELIDIPNYRPKDKKLKRAIKGMEDRILFIGPKKERALQKLYTNALVTIMPSHYESFGMVAAEAQACGCPVIATKVGGLKDVVKAGVTGFHFTKSNVQHLSSRMAYFLKRSTKGTQMREAARRFAHKEYNWKRISRKLEELYN